MASQRGGGYDLAIEKQAKKKEALGGKTSIPTRSFFGNMVPARSAPVTQGSDPQAPESIGDLMTPTVGREFLLSSPEEYSSRVQRNMGFLRNPSTQAMLAQFAQSIAGGSSVGNAFEAASKAPARLYEAQSKAAHQRWEDEIKRGEYILSQQKFLAEQEQNAAQLAISQGNLDVSRRSQQWDEEKYWRDLREGRPKAALEEAKLKQDLVTGDLTQEEASLDIIKKRKDLHEFDRIEKLRASISGEMGAAEEVDKMSADMILDAAGRLAAGGDTDTANAFVAIANAKGAMMTNDIKNYLGALADGSWKVEDGLAGWVRMQGQSTAPQTAALTSEGGVLSPQAQDAAYKADSAAQALGTQVRDLEFLQKVARDTPTGWTVPYTKPLKAALLSFGIDLDDEDTRSLKLQENFLKETNKLALLLRNPEGGYGLPGNASNQDLNFLVSSVPNLENHPDSNKAIIITMLARQRMEMLVEQGKSNYLFAHGVLGEGWTKARENIITNADVVTPEEQEFIESLVNPQRMPPGNGDATPAGESPTTPNNNSTAPAPKGLGEEDTANWALYDDMTKQAIINQHEAAKAEQYRGVR